MYRLLLAVVFAILSIAQTSPAQTPPGTADRLIRSQAKAKPAPKPDLRRILRTRVPVVEWDDQPFGEVVEWFREQGQANVVVRWNRLIEQGIDEDSPVTLRLKDVKLATVLSEVLAQLSEGEELRFIGIGSTLTISTRADLNRKLYVKVYSVNDLLMRVPDFTDAPTVNLEQGGGGGGAGGGSSTQNPFQGGGGDVGGDDERRSKAERIAELIEVIKTTVDPESWRDAGGEGTIQAFNSSALVVRASLEVHQKLGGSMVID